MNIKFLIEAIGRKGTQQVNPKGLPYTNEREPLIISQRPFGDGLNCHYLQAYKILVMCPEVIAWDTVLVKSLFNEPAVLTHTCTKSPHHTTHV